MRLTLFSFLFLAAFSPVAVAAGVEQAASDNLLQKEMLALDSVLKVTVDAIVLNEPARIVPAFREVNEIREQIEQAVKGKTKITLPRNQKRFKEFVRLDNKFHRDLEILLAGARKGNMGAVQRQTHRILDECVRCHRIFRR